MKKFKQIHLLTFLGLSLMSTGCGIYNSGFQCPPGRGVGCASTSEVLEMIVENETPPDEPYDSGKNHFVPETRSCK